jgi:hypothetical protein
LNAKERRGQRSDHASDRADDRHDVRGFRLLWSHRSQRYDQHKQRDQQGTDDEPKPVRYSKCFQVFVGSLLALLSVRRFRPCQSPNQQRKQKTARNGDEKCDRDPGIE